MCDHFGICTQSLVIILGNMDFLKVAKRKPLPTTSESSAQRMAHNFKVMLKTEHSIVKAELMRKSDLNNRRSKV